MYRISFCVEGWLVMLYKCYNVTCPISILSSVLKMLNPEVLPEGNPGVGCPV